MPTKNPGNQRNKGESTSRFGLMHIAHSLRAFTNAQWTGSPGHTMIIITANLWAFTLSWFSVFYVFIIDGWHATFFCTICLKVKIILVKAGCGLLNEQLIAKMLCWIASWWVEGWVHGRLRVWKTSHKRKTTHSHNTRRCTFRFNGRVIRSVNTKLLTVLRTS